MKSKDCSVNRVNIKGWFWTSSGAYLKEILENQSKLVEHKGFQTVRTYLKKIKKKRKWFTKTVSFIEKRRKGSQKWRCFGKKRTTHFSSSHMDAFFVLFSSTSCSVLEKFWTIISHSHMNIKCQDTFYFFSLHLYFIFS